MGLRIKFMFWVLSGFLLFFSDAQFTKAQPAAGAGASEGSPHAFIKQWGSHDPGNKSFLPNRVFVDPSGNLLVGDNNSDLIQKFDVNGNFLVEWHCGTNSPSMAFDRSNNVYVVILGGGPVRKFDPKGNLLFQFVAKGTGGPTDDLCSIASDQKKVIYVSHSQTPCIQEYNFKGKLLRQWGEYAMIGDGVPIDKRPHGKFGGVDAMAVDSLGNLYVMDHGERIQKFTSKGKWLRQWGGQGNGKGSFYMAEGLAIDKDNQVYTVEPFANRIQEFDSNGRFLIQWGSAGGGNGFFKLPGGVGVDTAGNVYVADAQNQIVQKFGPFRQ